MHVTHTAAAKMLFSTGHRRLDACLAKTESSSLLSEHTERAALRFFALLAFECTYSMFVVLDIHPLLVWKTAP